MKVIIYGASRGIGRQIVEQALSSDYEVTAVARDVGSLPKVHGKLNVVRGDVTDPALLDQSLKGQDAVLCALGAGHRRATTLYSAAARNLVEAMPRAGVDRLVFVSNFGVLGEVKGLFGVLLGMRLHNVLADHRQALDLLRASSLRWTAVRPTILTDGPLTGKYRVSGESLPPRGSKISRADVADFMLKQLRDETYIRAAPGIAY